MLFFLDLFFLFISCELKCLPESERTTFNDRGYEIVVASHMRSAYCLAVSLTQQRKSIQRFWSFGPQISALTVSPSNHYIRSKINYKMLSMINYLLYFKQASSQFPRLELKRSSCLGDRNSI